LPSRLASILHPSSHPEPFLYAERPPSKDTSTLAESDPQPNHDHWLQCPDTDWTRPLTAASRYWLKTSLWNHFSLPLSHAHNISISTSQPIVIHLIHLTTHVNQYQAIQQINNLLHYYSTHCPSSLNHSPLLQGHTLNNK
jgi:hypothetical protein